MGRPATLRVDILADAKGVGRGVAEAESKLGKLGKAGKAVGAAAATGLLVAGAAAAKFGVDSVKAASRTQQAYGALETIYGKSAKQVQRWSKGAADSVGPAASEYAELSSLVGSQLQNMGFAQDASAKRSDKLIRLGADLAATYGGTVSDAVSAVSSLMKGEADPIERYGVSIKASDVSARLAAQGLDKLQGSALKQAQAQAMLSLLNEQTAKTTGAFRRESNTLAGQQERLKAKFENLKSTVGQKLLPVVTKLVGWLGNKLLPAAEKLGGQLSRQLGPTFAVVGRFITGTLVPAVSRVWSWFKDKLAPIIVRNMQPALRGIKSAFSDVKAAIDRNREPIQKIISAFKALIEFHYKYIQPIVGKAMGLAFRAAGIIISRTVDHIGRLTNGISWAIDKIKDLISWLGNIKVPDIGGAIGRLVPGAAELQILAPQLAGESPSYDRRRPWSTAAASLGDLGGWATFAGTPAGQPVVVVDRRDLSTSVQLAPDPLGLVDEAQLARRLQRLLDRHAVRVGQASTLRLS